jgi:hypothetical protein
MCERTSRALLLFWQVTDSFCIVIFVFCVTEFPAKSKAHLVTFSRALVLVVRN